ncbi:hypothetical protein BDR26DRAFT_1007473 [Obelidium mucronatum]|nr:hypothetical protein BDR26DRAFT_1007473 [Obelidium mucronatum]
MVPRSLMPLLALLLAAAITSVDAYRYRNKTGHLDYSVSNAEAVSHCRYAIRVTGSPTCQQLSDEIGIELKTFKNLNVALDCKLPFIKANTLICVPFNPDPTIEDDGAVGSDSKGGNGTLISGNGTLAVGGNATLLAGGNSTLLGNATATAAVATTAAPSPSPTARQYYNPGVSGLTWSDNLAGLAQYSADFSAENGCCTAACHTLSGGGTGIAQVLYCSKTTCAEAYDGWITQEAPYLGEHYVTYCRVSCGLSILWMCCFLCEWCEYRLQL